MAWRIDRDYLDPAPSDYCEVGRASVLDGPMPYRFRLRDDDGEVYYGGTFGTTHDEDTPGEWESSPYGCLKWAEGNAGATDFQVRAEDAEASGLYSGAVERFGAGEWVSIYG